MKLHEMDTETLADLFRYDADKLTATKSPSVDILLEANKTEAYCSTPLNSGARLEVFDHEDGRQFAIVLLKNDDVWCGFEVVDA